MVNSLETLSEAVRWRLLVDAAKQAAEAAGYKLNRIPGRGLSNIWNLTKDGKTQAAAIRTTRDRWIAFPPLEKGTKWKTLDDVELVLVAAVDSKENPQSIEVYIFPAADVRQRFNASYAARSKAGHVVRDGYGMWVGLDHDDGRTSPSWVGSGIIDQYKRLATYPIDELLAAAPAVADEAEEIEGIHDAHDRPQPSTIAEVMAWARERVAELAGVRIEAVKLDLKVEY